MQRTATSNSFVTRTYVVDDQSRETSVGSTNISTGCECSENRFIGIRAHSRLMSNMIVFHNIRMHCPIADIPMALMHIMSSQSIGARSSSLFDVAVPLM